MRPVNCRCVAGVDQVRSCTRNANRPRLAVRWVSFIRAERGLNAILHRTDNEECAACAAGSQAGIGEGKANSSYCSRRTSRPAAASFTSSRS